MAIALVQSTSKAESGVDTSALAYTSNVTSGNLLIVSSSTYHFLGPTPTVSDSRGFTWAALPGLGFQELESGDVVHFSWYTLASSSGACTVTMDSDRTSVDYGFVISEWSGVDNGDLFTMNVATGISTGGSTTPATGTIDPDTDPGTLYASCTHSDGNTAFTLDGAWTLVAEREDGTTGTVFNVGYRALASGTTTASWTLGTSAPWACHAIGLKEAAGAATKAPMPHRYNRAHLIGR